MSEINWLIIMGIVKTSKLNFKSRKKILFLRSCLLFKCIFNFFYSRYCGTNKRQCQYLVKKNDSFFLRDFYGKQFKFFFINFIFHFLAGSYPIGMIYFSFMKGIIKLPFFITNI